ncbi:uncharacterized protein LOC142583672 [Dermacentor variabilis]|uniref:uncharacterized protein LOC142583672 n=1 Tax=Dermacentor variabilis TaxID=34621 RepID=UPI003F5AEC8D
MAEPQFPVQKRGEGKVEEQGGSGAMSRKAEEEEGASAGIGASTALHFASLGCSLSLTARNKAALDSVAKACWENGLSSDKVLVLPGDVTVGEDVAAVVEKTVKHFGKIDILVNNAGILMEGYTDTATMEQFDTVWNVNFRGPLCVMRHTLPYLRESKGCKG